MRIALITLAVSALAFIVGILWIFANKTGINIGSPIVSPLKISNEATSIELLKSQWATEQRIKDLEAKIDTLTKNSGVMPTAENQTPTTQSKATNNQDNKDDSKQVIVPISAKFLSKIIQKVSPNLDKNTGIFWLYIFDSNTQYSTYTDQKYGITIIATRVPYNTFQKNFTSLDPSLYTINPATWFPFAAFFVNPPQPDDWVRLVMQVESQTLFVTLKKNQYKEFKKMLNNT